MSTIEDQPAPKPTTRTPAWELVINYVEAMSTQHPAAASATWRRDGVGHIAEQVLADMRERDRIGRERYGVPLTADNGRKHLVDAYQEMLDAVVYLAAEIDEDGGDFDLNTYATRLFKVQLANLFDLRHLLVQRGL
jgi:hypothetical protein